MDLSQIQHLIDQLSADFGSGFLITLDPVGTDVTKVPAYGMAGFHYKDLYTSPEGSKLAWFNVQFYNGWGSISSTSDYDNAVTNGFPSDKVVAGMLCNQGDGGGYVDINTVANSSSNLWCKNTQTSLGWPAGSTIMRNQAGLRILNSGPRS